MRNSSVMTCLMPEVSLPSDFQVNSSGASSETVSAGGGVVSLSGGPDGRDRADVYVGLVFDGFTDYANLTAAMPQLTFQFFEPPTFDAVDVIVYRPQSLSDIDITVSDLSWCYVSAARTIQYDTIRYDTRCYFNVRSKADTSQLNLPHGNNS